MVAELMTGLTFVLANWLVLSAVLVGAGWLIERAACGVSPSAGSLLRWFWLGVAAWVGAAQVWNFFLPMNALFCVFMAGLGGWGLIRGRASIARCMLQIRSDVGALGLIALSAVALWTANRGMGPPLHPDSELYHLSAVRWYASSALPPGLGNIIDTIGFNNANHLLHAALEGSGRLWHGRSFHVIHSLMAFTLFGRIVMGSVRLLRGRRDHAALDVFYLLTLTPIVGIAISNNISSPTTDWPGMAAAFIGTAELIGLIFGANADQRVRAGHLLAAVTLLTLSVTFKLTHIVYSGVGSMIALGIWAGMHRPVLAFLRERTTWAVIAAAGLLLVPWVGRSIVISGYAAYPLAATRLSVDWAVSAPQAEYSNQWIIASARGVRLCDGPSAPWLAGWIKWQFKSANLGLTILPALILLATGTVLLWAFVFGRRHSEAEPKHRDLARAVLILAPGLVSLSIWFAQAPQPRVGGFILWTLAAVMSMLAWRAMIPGRMLTQLGVVAAIIMGLGPIAAFLAMSARGKISGQTARSPLYVAPGSDMGMHPAPIAPLAEFRTLAVDGGGSVALRVPLETLGCWDAALPATHLATRQLVLRDPSDAGRGFRTAETTLPNPDESDVQAAWATLRGAAKPGDWVVPNADAAALIESARAAGVLPDGLTILPADLTNSDVRSLTNAVGKVPSRNRVWYIHAEGPLGPAVDERGTMLAVFGSMGDVEMIRHHGGMCVALFKAR